MRKDDHRVIFAIPIQDAGATGPVEAHVTHGNDVVLASTPKWTHWTSSAACFFWNPGGLEQRGRVSHCVVVPPPLVAAQMNG